MVPYEPGLFLPLGDDHAAAMGASDDDVADPNYAPTTSDNDGGEDNEVEDPPSPTDPPTDPPPPTDPSTPPSPTF